MSFDPIDFNRAGYSHDSNAAYFAAISFGVVAAIVGCVLYAIVFIATGWNIGYAAIGVAYLIGWAMKKGAGGIGGQRYQITAAILTYLACAMSFLPRVLWDYKDVEGFGGGIRWGYTLGVSVISPLYEFTTVPISAVINVVILFYAIRCAWQFTKE
jgi:hypothetical protein